MIASTSTILATLLSIAPQVLAHSHVDEIWAPDPNGYYVGWNPNYYDTTPYPDNTPGWYTQNRGGNPMYPSDANQNQIICSRGASSANISATVPSGASIRVKWWQVPGPDGYWPPSHTGPIIDYLAECNGPCEDADPTTLKFVKIAQSGWYDTSKHEGYWASDKLRNEESQWRIQIPAQLKPGNYILRHELIALHLAHLGYGAYSAIGAEFYPQCINLVVTGSGTKTLPAGTFGKELYTGAEPGLQYASLHLTDDHSAYVIPGPPVWVP
ncbi:lytic polysaccharide monooxygenase [Amniculicola lignicola CBS 123094]|uniref:Lytic polysaccharide monooxygenase n=1 Tax=Amniculicola lignicola CBS 123094 TaxID=1392246 RepID=A0A6A5WSM8_9PLEO|nr:lytic polysaccharide monooxygenase [Amniculicola lignicola CBS 123094]